MTRTSCSQTSSHQPPATFGGAHGRRRCYRRGPRTASAAAKPDPHARTGVRPLAVNGYGRLRATLTGALRFLGAGMLAASAGIHLTLYREGYREINIIGTLFILDAVLASLGCIAVLTASRRWLTVASTTAATLLGGTLGGLLLSLHGSLFGFVESPSAPYIPMSIMTDSVGVVVLTALTTLALRATNGRRTP